MIQICTFKEKEKEGGEGRLDDQWKVLSSMAFEMFHVWWPMVGSKFGGPWNVPCLVVNGRF
jgi:hypothetical protein